jgi:outer membrane protein OmpA-like peptidoglycan-associated protein
MHTSARLRLALVWLAAAGALAGCMTKHTKPQLSRAVIDARAHRDAPTVAACPQGELTALSPVLVGFAFNESELTESLRRPLATPAKWLACHPATAAVIKPDADNHGPDSDQDALAQARGEGVKAYLVAQGVAADRITVLRRGATEPAGGIFLIRAEGRRW